MYGIKDNKFLDSDYLILFELNTHATAQLPNTNIGVFKYFVHMLIARNIFIPDDVYQRALISAFSIPKKWGNNLYNIMLLEYLKPHIFRQHSIEYSILGNDIRNYDYFCKVHGENRNDALMFLAALCRLNIINFGHDHVIPPKLIRNKTGLRRVNNNH